MSLTKASYSMITGSPVNVMDFGAKGDGTTDDSAAINSAIAAGSEIYFPDSVSTYYIASSIIVTSDKTLTGANGATILANNGITAIWVQGNSVSINGLNITFNSTLGNFSNTSSIGILVRNTASFNLPVSSWAYVNTVKIENCNIRQAYISIKMEAVFYCSIDKVNTYSDFKGLSINDDQQSANGSVNVPLPATTISMHRVYFHGTQTAYTIPSNSTALISYAIQSLLIQECVTEYYDLAIDLYAISGGTLINHYLENTNIGFQIYGALTPFIVINPWILKGVSALPYAFRSGAGNITFIGGKATMGSGADNFYSPNPDLTGTATFVTLPSVSVGAIYPDATKLVGGITKTRGINLPTSFSSPTVDPTTALSYIASGTVLTSGVPFPITNITLVSGAMVFVTGYSLTGGGQFLIIYGDTTAVVAAANNNTGGTVAFSVVSGQLNVTSTGSASQVLQYVWATSFST